MDTPRYKVYMLRCEDGSLYTGITTDVERRFAEHASGGPKAARYTRTHRPVEVAAVFDASGRSEASALEYRIKRLSRDEKLALAADPSLIDALRPSPAPPRVLMLGNSLTASHGMPDLLAGLLGAEVAVHARGGARLSEHLNPKTRLGSMTQEALRAGGWDFVVLQEMSNGPVRFRERYLESAAALCEAVRSSGAEPVIYATWAYAPGCPKLDKLGLSLDEMYERMHEAFLQAATDGAALLADACLAFHEDPERASLYARDGVHPSEAGARLAAETIARCVNRAS